MPEVIPIGADHAGVDMSYAANRHRGGRAAVAWSPEIARLAREHNDSRRVAKIDQEQG
jgi:ribose 5-phosphate isomerase B